MIIDSHTHIVSRAVRENLEEHCKRDALMGHMYWTIYGKKKAKMIGAEDLIASMDEAGIDKSGICTYPWTNHELCVEGNDYILESINRYPERLFGFCCVQPMAGNSAIAEIERCVSHGMVGVGELALTGMGVDIENKEVLDKIMETIRRLGVCLLIHSDEPVGHHYLAKGDTTPKQIYKLVTRYPDITFILAHWGGGFFFYELMHKVRDEAKNVYYDTANSPFVYSPRVYRTAVEIVGAKKILFGTDYPLINQRKQMEEIEGSGISQADMKKIFGENVENLLQID